MNKTTPVNIASDQIGSTFGIFNFYHYNCGVFCHLQYNIFFSLNIKLYFISKEWIEFKLFAMLFHQGFGPETI